MWPEASAGVVQDLIDRLTTNKPTSNYDMHANVQSQSTGEQNATSTATGATGITRPEDIWSHVTSNHCPGQYTAADLFQASDAMQTDVNGNEDIDLFQGFEIPFWIGDDNANFWTT